MTLRRAAPHIHPRDSGPLARARSTLRPTDAGSPRGARGPIRLSVLTAREAPARPATHADLEAPPPNVVGERLESVTHRPRSACAIRSTSVSTPAAVTAPPAPAPCTTSGSSA